MTLTTHCHVGLRALFQPASIFLAFALAGCVQRNTQVKSATLPSMYSAEARILPSQIPIIWDAHSRFVGGGRDANCFYVLVETRRDVVDVSYIRRIKESKRPDGLIERTPVCASESSVTFEYFSDGRFLRHKSGR